MLDLQDDTHNKCNDNYVQFLCITGVLFIFVRLSSWFVCCRALCKYVYALGGLEQLEVKGSRSRVQHGFDL